MRRMYRSRSPIFSLIREIRENLVKGGDRFSLGPSSLHESRRDPSFSHSLREDHVRDGLRAPGPRWTELRDHSIAIRDEDGLTLRHEPNVFAQLILESLDADTSHDESRFL